MVKVVRDGDFLAVVAEQEFQAVKAMRLLAAAAQWQEDATLPDQDRLPEALLALPAQDFPILERYGATPSASGRTLEARYSRPYLLHGSIGPSCAVAQQDQDGLLTVWTHTQGVYPDRKAIAEMLGRPPEQVRCIHVQGSGCYGHNGADDAAADAALLAVAPARPPGAGAVDARAGARLGALWPGDGGPGPGDAGRGRPHRRLGLRGVEQHPFDAPRPGRQPAGRPASGQAVPGAGAEAAAGSRRAAATATPFRSTPCPAPGWCIISCRTCRCASPPCARSARR